jgi:hypothetical protein
VSVVPSPRFSVRMFPDAVSTFPSAASACADVLLTFSLFSAESAAWYAVVIAVSRPSVYAFALMIASTSA